MKQPRDKKSILPYGRHYIDADDIEAVARVLKTGLLTAGPLAEQFETAFAKVIGCQEAVVCSNGTTALHLAMLGAGIGPGDSVIVPSVTFLATANAALMCGADIIFSDVDPESGLMRPDDIEHIIAHSDQVDRIKAIAPVHLNGQTCDMSSIATMARQRDWKIITDCCHALGARYLDGGAPGDGRFEDMGTFSLHPVKTIAMGEGGVVTLNDPVVANKLRRLRSHDMTRQSSDWMNTELGFDRLDENKSNTWYYEAHDLGYNYRASEIHCALGISQLAKLDQFVHKRRQLAGIYHSRLQDTSPNIVPVVGETYAFSAWHLYPVRIAFGVIGKSRRQVMSELLEIGIGSQVHYMPLHKQPVFEKRLGRQTLHGAESYYETVLSLPLFYQMTEDDVHYVCDALGRICMG